MNCAHRQWLVTENAPASAVVSVQPCEVFTDHVKHRDENFVPVNSSRRVPFSSDASPTQNTGLQESNPQPSHEANARLQVSSNKV